MGCVGAAMLVSARAEFQTSQPNPAESCMQIRFLSLPACLFVMVALPLIFSEFRISFRLELLFLIPYLIKIWRIKPAWVAAQV